MLALLIEMLTESHLGNFRICAPLLTVAIQQSEPDNGCPAAQPFGLFVNQLNQLRFQLRCNSYSLLCVFLFHDVTTYIQILDSCQEQNGTSGNIFIIEVISWIF